MAEKKLSLPPCGLYRTGRALPGQEEKIPAGKLVMFHNHSDQGPPLVLLPATNENNVWTFHKSGWAVHAPEFLQALVPLRAEGLYVVSGQIYTSREQMLPDKTLVQLGYNRDGDSILFPADFVGNSIHFPTQGFRFKSTEVQKNLASVGFIRPSPKTLH